MGKTSTMSRAGGLGMALLVLLVTGAGCTRQFYRHRTDDEVASLLGEKDRIPQWKVQNMYVYPSPAARFADPSRPDRPPMPPDDPGADLLAPRPQRPGKTGVRWQEGKGYLDLLCQWDAENRARGLADDKDNRLDRSTVQAALKHAGTDPAVRAFQVALKQAVPGGVQQVAFLQSAAAQGPETVPAPKIDERGGPPRQLQSPPDVQANAPTVQTSNIDIKGYLLRGDAGVRPYLLNVEQGLQLALINSREFQTRREDLYLAALPVTLQRFSFAAQGVALGSAFRGHGGDRTAIPGSYWNVPTQAQVGKLFSTGALLLAQFANQTIVHLGNPLHPQTTSVSTINLDFIQPLLRGGGRAVTLEPLTLAERNLLYNVRNFARFRKQYYQYLTGGSNLPGVGGGAGLTGVSAATGSTSAAGVIGVNASSNVGPSGLSTAGLGASVVPGLFPGFAFPSNPVTPGASGALFISFTPSAPSEGLYSTILKTGVLDIGLQNVRRLQEGLKLFEGFEQGGEVSKLQVDQVRLQLLQGLSTVLTNAQSLRDSFDNIKLQLGLPVTTQLELDTALIKPIMSHMAKFEQVITDYDATAKELDDLDAQDRPAQLRAGLLRLLATSKLTAETSRARKEIPALWERIQRELATPAALTERITKLREERRRLQDLKSELEEKEQVFTPAQQRQLANVETELALSELEFAVRRYETAPWQKAANPRDALVTRAARWRDVRNAFTLILGEASNERLELLRPNWPKLPPILIAGVDIPNGDIEQSYAAVIKTAMDNRLDLMNARAQVHDAWRQVAVLANGLLGVFNVGYTMSASTPPGMGTPLAFRPELTTNNLVFNFQLPIVRIQERNTYRAALIGYQRARRALMEAEDTIVNSLRSQVRQLQVLAKNFIIQEQNVELAFLVVESSLETFRAPPAVGAQVGNAANAAALTTQVLNAYARVPTVQGQLLNNWITYITARQQIFLDTELMQIDPRGVWIDDFAQYDLPCGVVRPSFGPPVAAPSGDAVGRQAVRWGGLAE